MSIINKQSTIHTNNKINENEICYSDYKSHLTGAFCLTTCGGSDNNPELISSILCLPFKIVLCIPCHFGVCINSSLNLCCNSGGPNKNYLF